MWIVSLVCLVALIALSVIGENTLGLFGGDRDLAARVTKGVFALLGGVGFAFVQPAIWSWFGGVLQKLIGQGGAQGGLAQYVMRPDFKSTLGTVGMVACVVFTVASALLAVQLVRGKL